MKLSVEHPNNDDLPNTRFIATEFEDIIQFGIYIRMLNGLGVKYGIEGTRIVVPVFIELNIEDGKSANVKALEARLAELMAKIKS